ncbi:MAG: hypothetical protein B9J98_07000 [Candidatus Terraquivivens tikiterensis]|uniref:FAD/NAD(P)-binding domain-containing protein n=1 Tax=Candidatus Terraquivivens tikiterensis TaxID=1980982 RepID=A0A2R7Y147_9ARCH|nr:MAG: hypothetical protein B9J98_07000 [Candidatus Terraquivivens tikiterensis]
MARKLSPSEASITLVDASGRHVYQPGFIYVAFGGERPENLIREERSLLDRHVNLIIDEATLREPDDRRARLNSGRVLDYDYLVVATGSRLRPEGLPGFEAAHHFYDLDASIRLREALENFPGGRVLTFPRLKPEILGRLIGSQLPISGLCQTSPCHGM